MARTDDTHQWVESLLMQYSEWLDMQGLVVGDGYGGGRVSDIRRKLPGEDSRTHQELVRDFLNE